ncbi:hypothetical protein Holit_03281 [Hollandina sp. SP2]
MRGAGNRYKDTKQRNLLLAPCSLLLDLSVLVVEINRRRSSLQSYIMLLYSAGESSPVSLRRSSQYSVSAHSFREMVSFTRYSLRLTAYLASLMFAPTEVPEHNNCLANIYSCFLSQRNLYKLYIRMANLRLFSMMMVIVKKDHRLKKVKQTRKKE